MRSSHPRSRVLILLVLVVLGVRILSSVRASAATDGSPASILERSLAAQRFPDIETDAKLITTLPTGDTITLRICLLLDEMGVDEREVGLQPLAPGRHLDRILERGRADVCADVDADRQGLERGGRVAHVGAGRSFDQGASGRARERNGPQGTRGDQPIGTLQSAQQARGPFDPHSATRCTRRATERVGASTHDNASGNAMFLPWTCWLASHCWRRREILSTHRSCRQVASVRARPSSRAPPPSFRDVHKARTQRGIHFTRLTALDGRCPVADHTPSSFSSAGSDRCSGGGHLPPSGQLLPPV